MKALRNVLLALVILFTLTALPAVAGTVRTKECTQQVFPAWASPGCFEEDLYMEVCFTTWVHNFADGGGNDHWQLHWLTNGHATSGNFEYNVNMHSIVVALNQPLGPPVPGTIGVWHAMDVARFVGKGQAPNFLVNIVSHYTVVGEEVSAHHDISNLRCGP